jgi:predicted GIY-YIG superfamily endonuclease
MTQMLLFPDPRPLVERLGLEFFKQAPESAGVYLMRDASDSVLYVGKAKNLRKRLASYRVANPDRLKPRHLRLLRAVVRIEVRECPDELAALARESELLRALRPRFNRAGTWPGTPRFFGWRLVENGLDLTITTIREEGWVFHGPVGAGAFFLRSSLARLLWCALHPDRGLAGMPLGWFQGDRRNVTTIPGHGQRLTDLEKSDQMLKALFSGDAEQFYAWITDRTGNQIHPFELAVRAEDLETVKQFILNQQAAIPP